MPPKFKPRLAHRCCLALRALNSANKRLHSVQNTEKGPQNTLPVLFPTFELSIRVVPTNLEDLPEKHVWGEVHTP